MTRERLEELISASLDEALEPAERQELESELQSSPQARALRDACARDRERLRELPRPTVPADLSRRIHAQTHRQRLNSDWRRGLGLAASVALVFWLVTGRSDGRLPVSELAREPLLEGSFRGGATRLRVRLDAGTRAGLHPVVKLSYDFNGDGHWERSELSAPLPLDDREGWQSFDIDTLVGSEGPLQDFRGGRVRFELVDADGVQLDADGSYLYLPYQWLREGNSRTG